MEQLGSFFEFIWGLLVGLWNTVIGFLDYFLDLSWALTFVVALLAAIYLEPRSKYKGNHLPWSTFFMVIGACAFAMMFGWGMVAGVSFSLVVLAIGLIRISAQTDWRHEKLRGIITLGLALASIFLVVGYSAANPDASAITGIVNRFNEIFNNVTSSVT